MSTEAVVTLICGSLIIPIILFILLEIFLGPWVRDIGEKRSLSLKNKSIKQLQDEKERLTRLKNNPELFYMLSIQSIYTEFRFTRSRILTSTLFILIAVATLILVTYLEEVAILLNFNESQRLLFRFVTGFLLVIFVIIWIVYAVEFIKTSIDSAKWVKDTDRLLNYEHFIMEIDKRIEKLQSEQNAKSPPAP